MTEKTFEITLTIRFDADVPDDYFDDAVWDAFTSQTNADMWESIYSADVDIQEVDG